jgi:hypothetical protein
MQLIQSLWVIFIDTPKKIIILRAVSPVFRGTILKNYIALSRSQNLPASGKFPWKFFI